MIADTQTTACSKNKLKYRAEIDGLRAIAVASVILYHAQMIFFGQDWFQGGFIGVDIFFVISGYLITRIILLELDTTGSFNFLKFYDRRIRRILPMLFLVVFASIPFAWFILLPNEIIEYWESILASILFGSNFFFYLTTTAYGSDSALLKPFLHTWSLSVEEQFYLVFPIIAVVSYKFARRHFVTALIVLSVLSLLFSQLMEVRNSELNFYLPFSRFWELAVGSLLATYELKNTNHKILHLKKYLSVLGLVLIIFSIFFFDSKTHHPGFLTIIPILGVALILAFTSQEDLVGKLLSTRPFVALGLISYSAYLWHFPIFAFARVEGFVLTNSAKVFLIAITLILSAVTYKSVEKYFRNAKKVSTKALMYSLSIAAFLVVCVSFLTIQNSGYPERFSKLGVLSKKMIFYKNQYWNDYSPFINNERGTLIDFKKQEITKKNILIIGNSWAHDIAVGFSRLENVDAQFENMTGHKCNEYTLPILGVDHQDYNQWLEICKENAGRFNNIPLNTDIVVLADNVFYNNQYDEPEVRQAFENNIKNLRKNFQGRILIIKGRPAWTKEILRIASEVPAVMPENNIYIQKYLHQDYQTMLEIDAYYRKFYKQYSVEYISLIKPFCNQNICRLLGDDKVFYFDAQHLTLDGIDEVSEHLENHIR